MIGKFKVAATFAVLCLFGTIFMVQWNHAREIPKPVQAPPVEIHDAKAGILPEEPAEKVELPPAKQEKKREAVAEGAAKVADVQEQERPDLLKVGNRYYFLFDTDVLLPLAVGTWREYVAAGAENYGAVAKYHPIGETPSKWTQEFAVHEVKTDLTSYDFVDKLITGVIVSLETQMNGKELTQENLLFSFVKKDPQDTILFWHRKDVPGLDDEVQFLRCFNGKHTGKMYLATLTLKASPDDLKKEDIEEYVRVMTQVQELKEKKEN